MTRRILAPVEPTKEMLEAGVNADDKRTGYETCAHIYRAMLAAAPNAGRVSNADVERAAKASAVMQGVQWDTLGDNDRDELRLNASAVLRAIGLEVEG